MRDDSYIFYWMHPWTGSQWRDFSSDLAWAHLCWWHMTGDIVLSSLQLLDNWNRSAIQQRVAVVDSCQDDAAGNGLCHFSSQVFTHMWQGTSVVVARPDDSSDVDFKAGCQWSHRGTSAEMRLVSSSSSSTTFFNVAWITKVTARSTTECKLWVSDN